MPYAGELRSEFIMFQFVPPRQTNWIYADDFRLLDPCPFYLGDVFVVPEYRGQALAKWLMECVMSHPELQNLRRWMLVTKDARGLYRKCGFTPLARPEGFCGTS